MAASARTSSPIMAARTPTVVTPPALGPSMIPAPGSKVNSYCLGSIPRKREERATAVQPADVHMSPIPPTSDSAKLTFSSPVSDGPTVTRSVMASPKTSVEVSVTARAVTSTVKEEASASFVGSAVATGEGVASSRVCFPSPPPQAARSRAIAASAIEKKAAPVSFLITILLTGDSQAKCPQI